MQALPRPRHKLDVGSKGGDAERVYPAVISLTGRWLSYLSECPDQVDSHTNRWGAVTRLVDTGHATHAQRDSGLSVYRRRRLLPDRALLAAVCSQAFLPVP